MTYLIAGGGPAAAHCAKAIRQRDQAGRIVMLAPEGRAYSRITVPEYLTGEIAEEDIYFQPEDFAAAHHLEILPQRLCRLLPEEHAAVLEDGRRITYDKALLATGSHPFLPPFADTSVKGVHQIWDKADAEGLSSVISPGKTAVIIGGGLVGMQAARALHSAGLRVTVVELASRLMPLQLDDAASSMLCKAAQRAGVSTRLGISVKQIVSSHNAVTGVRLEDGELLEADLVIVSVGVRPNLSMLDGLDLAHERGLETDEYMQTELRDVYAAGDVVIAPTYLDEGKKSNRAIWLNAVRQGTCAGANMAGEITAYEGTRSMNSIQLFGLGIASVGQVTADGSQQEIILSPPSSGRYQKLILGEDTRLAGAVLAGDVQNAGVLFHKLGSQLGSGFTAKLCTNPLYIGT